MLSPTVSVSSVLRCLSNTTYSNVVNHFSCKIVWYQPLLDFIWPSMICVRQDSCATHIERVRQKKSNPNMKSLTLSNNVRITGIRDCMRVCVAIVKLGFSCCAAGSVLCLFDVFTHA